MTVTVFQFPTVTYQRRSPSHVKNTTVPFCPSTFRASLSTNLCTVQPITCHEGKACEQKCSSTLSLTSALDGGDGQRHAPTALSQGKTRYPLYRKLGGPQGRSGRVRKISLPPGFDPRTAQPVASRYSDWAITAHLRIYVLTLIWFKEYTYWSSTMTREWTVDCKGRAAGLTCVSIPASTAAYRPWLNPQVGVLPTHTICSVQVRMQDKMSSDWKPLSTNVSFTGGLNERSATPTSGLALLRLAVLHGARTLSGYQPE